MKYGKFLISALLLAWLAWNTDWGQVGTSFARLRVELWLAAFGLFVLTQVVGGQRWRLLARPLGFMQSRVQFNAYVFIGMFTNLVLPTALGGDVVKAWYLASGSRRLAAALSVFVDRCSGLMVLLALACGATLLCPLELPARVYATVWGTAACSILGLASLPVLARVSRRFERLGRLVEMSRIYLVRPRLLLEATGLALVVQAGNVLVVWLIGRAIDAPVPASYYWILVPMVSLLVMVPISVNGMGVREWAVALFVAPLGVSAGTALSLAWLWFAVYTAAGMVGGVVYLCGSWPRPELGAEHGPVSDHSDQGRAGQHRSAA